MCAACDLEEHKAECLMEPRKLLAAIHKLHAENMRLDAENSELRSGAFKDFDAARKRPCVGGVRDEERPLSSMEWR